MLTLPDLTAYGGGGITLIVAAYVVLQACKRAYPGLKRHMPAIVTAAAAVLVATAMWVPQLFVWLAGTTVTAALVMMAHGGVQKMAGPRPPDEK